MTWILHDTSNDNRREFETKEEAQEAANDLVSLGAHPDNLEIEEDKMDVDIVDHTKASDGGTQSVEDNTPTDTQDIETAENTPAVGREMETDAEQELRNLGGDFTTEIKGTTVIKKKGLRVMQQRYDISVECELVTPPEETNHDYARAKATAIMPDGRTADAYGSASTSRGDDSFLLAEMADTRAKSRALSDITGIGHAVVEEMQGVDQ